MIATLIKREKLPKGKVKVTFSIGITGEDWSKHIGETIIPELKTWASPNEYETRKNNMGIEDDWTHKATGSHLDIMTYAQDISLFEGWLGDGWWPDEPPPQKIWAGMSRGLFMTGGKVFLSMTPLKEAWIFDELIKSNRPDIKVISDVSLWDAPHLYNHDLNILMKAGLIQDVGIKWLQLQKEEVFKTNETKEAEKFLNDRLQSKTVKFKDVYGREFEQDAWTYVAQNLHIHRFLKDIKDKNEILPRAFGVPKYLMGRVWKGFDRDKHIIEPFRVPPDWPISFQIDFHLDKPHAISFMATDPYNRHFIIDEVWKHLTREELADEIIRRKLIGWRIVGGEIDALSKGDTSYVRNRLGNVEDSFSVIYKKLIKFGIRLGVGSKDEKSYVRAVEEWFKGPNGIPLLQIFSTCTETIDQVERWVYTKEGKPSDEGHFPECIGRHSQMGIKYTEMNVHKQEGPEPSVGCAC